MLKSQIHSITKIYLHEIQLIVNLFVINACIENHFSGLKQ